MLNVIGIFTIIVILFFKEPGSTSSLIAYIGLAICLELLAIRRALIKKSETS